MSDCKRFVGRLIDLHYGELDGRAAIQVKHHLEACESCRAELAKLEELGGILNEFEVPSLDYEQVLDIARRVRASRPWHERVTGLMRTNLEPLERMFLPGILGAATCCLTLAPILFSDSVQRIPPLALLVCGVLWSSIYNSIIGALFDQSRSGKETIRLRVVLYGVLVSLLFMHFFYFIGLHLPLVPATLAVAFVLKLPGSLTVCSALALLLVGTGIGLWVRRRCAPHMLLVLVLYLSINLPGLSVYSHAAVTLRAVFDLALPVVLSGLVGLTLGRLLAYAMSHRGNGRAVTRTVT